MGVIGYWCEWKFFWRKHLCLYIDRHMNVINMGSASYHIWIGLSRCVGIMVVPLILNVIVLFYFFFYLFFVNHTSCGIRPFTHLFKEIKNENSLEHIIPIIPYKIYVIRLVHKFLTHYTTYQHQSHHNGTWKLIWLHKNGFLCRLVSFFFLLFAYHIFMIF